MSLKEVDELGSILIQDENKKEELKRNIQEINSNIYQQESRVSMPLKKLHCYVVHDQTLQTLC